MIKNSSHSSTKTTSKPTSNLISKSSQRELSLTTTRCRHSGFGRDKHRENYRHLDSENVRMAKDGNLVPGPRIKLSTIPNIGFGLFSERDYKKNALITIYGGRLHYSDFHGEYVFCLQDFPPIHVDAKDSFHPSEKGRWCNHGHARKLWSLWKDDNNAESEPSSKSYVGVSTSKLKPVLAYANSEYYVTTKNDFPICYIRAIRPIKAGEEIFVDYGPQYWN